MLLLFEHNPWNPLTRHAVANCPFDENAVLISAPEMRKRLRTAGFRNVRIDYRLFFPGFLSALRAGTRAGSPAAGSAIFPDRPVSSPAMTLIRFALVGLLNTAVGFAVLLIALHMGAGDYGANAMGYAAGLACPIC